MFAVATLRSALPRHLAYRGGIRSFMPSASPVQVGNPLDQERSAEDKRRVNHTNEESEYALGKFRSNALELVHQVPIIEVDGEMAICDGGGGAMGHPIEYISLEVPGEVEYCKYCALRYMQKPKK